MDTEGMADATDTHDDAAVVAVKQRGEEWQVTLNVGVQHFDVGPCYETEDEANWMSEQLSKAICNLLEAFGLEQNQMDITRTH